MTRTWQRRPKSGPRGLALGAILALISTSVVAATAAWRAMRLEPIPAAVPLPGSPAAQRVLALPASARPARTRPPVLDNDPFHADRQLPGARSVVTSGSGRAVVPTVPPEAVRLLGTVLRPAGTSFVVYQLPSELPKTVRVGESVGGMTLVDVAPGRATFRAQTGSLVELSLSKPGS